MRYDISDQDIEIIKAKSDLAEVVRSRGVALKRANQRELKGKCPFHMEKTPSFFVDPNKGQYHCFGCGASGDAISFVMDHQSMDFYDAVVELAGECGYSLDSKNVEQLVELSMKRKRELLPSMRDLVFPGKRSCHPELPESVWQEMQERYGSLIRPVAVPEYALPIGDSRIPSINKYAEKRFDLGEMREWGVMGCLSGRYAGRLVLPVYREKQLVFYQARDALGRSDRDKSVPKYTGPPRVSSGKHLGFLEDAIGVPEVIICEGWFSARRTGNDALCSFTCNLTDAQVELLRFYGFKKVCLCYDPDAWSVPAVGPHSKEQHPPVYRALMKLIKAGFQVRCARLIGGDPDDLGREKTRRMVAQAVPVSSEFEVATLFI